MFQRSSKESSSSLDVSPSSYSDYRKFMLKIVSPQNFGMIPFWI